MESLSSNKVPQSTIKGVYDHTIFANEENGWTVGVMRTPGNRLPTTVVGAFTATPGETLVLSGNWVHNKKFGEQFEVLKCEAQLPSTIDGLKKYLGSGLIKGIGPVYAERMIERFGLEVPRVIEETPHRLFEVAGIGKTRQKRIVDGWNAQKAIKNIMLFLQSHGVGTAFAVKIYKTYRDEAIQKVTANPYRLASDVHGIGFKTADRIAHQIGIEKDSVVRAEAGLLYTLRELSERNGHVFCPRGALISETAALLEIEEERVATALVGLIGGAGSPLVLERGSEPAQDSIYLRGLWECETRITERMAALSSTPMESMRAIQWDKFFEWYETTAKITFTAIQQKAIQSSYENRVSVVTGGPGTGKSTLIQALTALFTRLRLPFLLAAPTGRAAKRMTEVTGAEAKTIHRLLEFDPKTWSFKKNREEPLDCDLLIVDEASMLDLSLFDKLLASVPNTSRLMLVGDIDQLPSVGAGNVLGDLIQSERFPVVRLTEIFRQAAHSQIIKNAHDINRGGFQFIEGKGEAEAQDFFFIERDSPEKSLSLIVELCTTRIPKKFGFDRLRDIQVLSPMNRGEIGTKNLNVELQKALNPHSPYLERASRKYSVGDRVIQIRNNYDLDVFNGDIGFVEEVDQEEAVLSVRFDQKSVVYESSDLDELDLAYAISIHKSQGSEFPVVIIPLLTQHAVMLQRNLLYTAVTRGKKLVVLVGSKKAIQMAVSNIQRGGRYTGLSGKLKKTIDCDSPE